MSQRIRLLLTAKCTAHCAYCHNEGQGEGGNLLSLATIQDILRQIAAAGRVLDEIVLSGGEPTLHKHLGAIARLCRASGAKVSMDSHGGHPDLLAAALPFLDELKLHIDSFNPVIQQQRMGIALPAVLRSLALAKQFPALRVLANHPLHCVKETAAFVQSARTHGLDCKIIEMFRHAPTAITLRAMNWAALGYTQQNQAHWQHSETAHQLFIKQCGAAQNQENCLFIGADGIRKGLDQPILMAAKDFTPDLLAA